jgi:hypothetical protein
MSRLPVLQPEGYETFCSTPVQQEPEDPRETLAVADKALRRLTTGLRLPAGLFPVFAAAVAVQLATPPMGSPRGDCHRARCRARRAGSLPGIAALLLHRFRPINGVRVDGLVSQIVLAAGASDSLIYLGAFAAGVLAAFASLWWLVAAAAVAGGIGCALGARDHVAAVRRMIDILE